MSETAPRGSFFVSGDVFEKLEADLWEEFQMIEPDQSKAMRLVSLKLWGLRSAKDELERRLTKSVETRIN